MPATAARPTVKVKSLRRGLDILEFLLAASRQVSVADIIRQLRIPRTTAFEIVRTLHERGYLEAQATGTYRLGRQLYKLSLGYESASSLYQAGRGSVTAVRDRIGKTSYLSILDDDRVLVLLGAEGREQIVVPPPIGQTAPANWSADGILLLSDLPPSVVEQRAARLLEPSPTGRAPLDFTAVATLGSLGRRRGILITEGYQHNQITVMAVPVLSADDACVAALAVAAYSPALNAAARDAIAAALKQEAHRLGLAVRR